MTGLQRPTSTMACFPAKKRNDMLIIPWYGTLYARVIAPGNAGTRGDPSRRNESFISYLTLFPFEPFPRLASRSCGPN
jgi:hypothetical protein